MLVWNLRYTRVSYILLIEYLIIIVFPLIHFKLCNYRRIKCFCAFPSLCASKNKYLGNILKPSEYIIIFHKNARNSLHILLHCVHIKHTNNAKCDRLTHR